MIWIVWEENDDFDLQAACDKLENAFQILSRI
jgi:hypothetical protein